MKKKLVVIFVLASSLISLVISGYLFTHYYQQKPVVETEFINYDHATYTS